MWKGIKHYLHWYTHKMHFFFFWHAATTFCYMPERSLCRAASISEREKRC